MAGQGARGDDVLSDPDDQVTAAAGGRALRDTITLPGVERSVADGRRFVRRTIGSRHPVLDMVTLGVSELATNAIMHTPSGEGGQITIGLVAAGGFVRAEVTNDGTTAAKPRVRRDPTGESGRGILIVDALADAWGVIEGSGTTTVWAEFRASSWRRARPDAPYGGPPGA
jgi:anti-sigma regulatory factor (Ser/Thr protein kinase)